MTNKYNVLMFGFGNVAHGYSNDKLMKTFYPCSTHVQAIKNNQKLILHSVIDLESKNLKIASDIWKAKYTSNTIDQLDSKLDDIHILVVTAQIKEKLKLIKKLKNLKGVLFEKPFNTSNEAPELLSYCHNNNISLQVNYWRRSDIFYKKLSNSSLEKYVGQIQHCICHYGNGLFNNGVHIIDFCRMLLGESLNIGLLPSNTTLTNKLNDFNPAFYLEFDKKIICTFLPINFHNFRENSLKIFGTKGVLCIANEGLTNVLYKVQPNRAMSFENEVGFDNPIYLESTVGTGFENVYSNLLSSIISKTDLDSPAESAIKSENIANHVKDLFISNGE